MRISSDIMGRLRGADTPRLYRSRILRGMIAG